MPYFGKNKEKGNQYQKRKSIINEVSKKLIIAPVTLLKESGKAIQENDREPTNIEGVYKYKYHTQTGEKEVVISRDPDKIQEYLVQKHDNAPIAKKVTRIIENGIPRNRIVFFVGGDKMGEGGVVGVAKQIYPEDTKGKAHPFAKLFGGERDDPWYIYSAL